MSEIKVATQAELEAALKKVAAAKGVPDVQPAIILMRDGWFQIRGSAHVVARGSAHVVARGSAHVEARGSAHVEARESAHVEAWGSAHVEATKFVAITKQVDHTGQIAGGVVIAVQRPTTVEDWCAFYGIPVTDGIAVLFKAVRDDYRSSHGLLYSPGTQPEAPDWDGGRDECGGGLHFSFHPSAARDFDQKATRFLACPVALAEIRAPKTGDAHPNKVKARRICGPIVEVDRYGKSIQTAAVGATA